MHQVCDFAIGNKLYAKIQLFCIHMHSYAVATAVSGIYLFRLMQNFLTIFENAQNNWMFAWTWVQMVQNMSNNLYKNRE